MSVTSRMAPATWRRMFRDRPIVPLIGLLAVLVLVIAIVQPGIVGLPWAGVIMRAAVPLAILAGCQTLTMLTGGIDLSVGAVASMAGFVTATLIHEPGGVPVAIAVSLTAAALAGLVTGIGVGVFRVHPLIMTLGMSFVVLGLSNVWQLEKLQTGAGVPDSLRTVGSVLLFDLVPYSLVIFAAPAMAGCSMRSATTRSQRASRAPGPGRSCSSCMWSPRCSPASRG